MPSEIESQMNIIFEIKPKNYIFGRDLEILEEKLLIRLLMCQSNFILLLQSQTVTQNIIFCSLVATCLYITLILLTHIYYIREAFA